MIVPGHRRRDDEIAGLHQRAFAVDGGTAPLPSSTKRSADWLCRCAGATSPGTTICTPANSEVVIFDWPRKPGIFQHQHPPLGFLGGDQLAGFGHVVADRVELPQMRPAGAARLRRDQIAHHVPERGEIFAVDLLVERLAFRRLLHGFHG